MLTAREHGPRTQECVCVCVCVVAGCRAGQETGSLQAAGHQHHRHGLAVRQMQQDLLITDWALRPSAYPSVTQSVVFDGALHVCVCVCVCVCVWTFMLSLQTDFDIMFRALRNERYSRLAISQG